MTSNRHESQSTSKTLFYFIKMPEFKVENPVDMRHHEIYIVLKHDYYRSVMGKHMISEIMVKAPCFIAAQHCQQVLTLSSFVFHLRMMSELIEIGN